jgi:hypothetical protein
LKPPECSEQLLPWRERGTGRVEITAVAIAAVAIKGAAHHFVPRDRSGELSTGLQLTA